MCVYIYIYIYIHVYTYIIVVHRQVYVRLCQGDAFAACGNAGTHYGVRAGDEKGAPGGRGGLSYIDTLLRYMSLFILLFMYIYILVLLLSSLLYSLLERERERERER